MAQLHEASLETDACIFPAVQGIEEGNERSRVMQLHDPFVDLGFVAVSAARRPGARWAGEHVFTFLAGASKFLVQGGPIENADSLRVGDHAYTHTMSELSREVRLDAARREVPIADGEHPLHKIVVGYTVRGERASHGNNTRKAGTTGSVGAASLVLHIEEHPDFSHYTARLYAQTTPPVKGAPAGWHHMGMGAWYTTHAGLPVVDETANFAQLAALGDKIAAFPMPPHQ